MVEPTTLVVTRSYEGDFVAARASLEKTLATFDPERDRDLAFRFAQDIDESATIHLAKTLWRKGKSISRAILHRKVEQADRTGHVVTMVYAHCVRAFLLVVRHDAAQAAVEVGPSLRSPANTRCRCYKHLKVPSQADAASHARAAAQAAWAPVVLVASGSVSGFPARPHARSHRSSSHCLLFSNLNAHLRIATHQRKGYVHVGRQ
jgi:hypothetical protein